jgi:hypothetical protein
VVGGDCVAACCEGVTHCLVAGSSVICREAQNSWLGCMPPSKLPVPDAPGRAQAVNPSAAMITTCFTASPKEHWQETPGAMATAGGARLSCESYRNIKRRQSAAPVALQKPMVSNGRRREASLRYPR